MLEALRNSINFQALWIASGILFVIGFCFFWGFRKVTGRRIGDIRGLLAGAVALTAVGLLIVWFLSPGLHSTDPAKHELFFLLATGVFGSAAVLIGWGFNRFVLRSRFKGRERTRSRSLN
ncbi:MAG TPA: hypothetical protein VKW06_09025 [Candidatus Angelobacter sp.]|nr:hypothetical protein [Candidatus Angelobacter sp.]